MAGFLKFCELYSIVPLDVSPVDVSRYISWLGERGKVAATSMQPYLSAINMFLQDHARPLVALLYRVCERASRNANATTNPLRSDYPYPRPWPCPS